tara:strand:+ start:253 stop:525 length:273 start_codon:yes stop_codon:yes gene_type:complete
MGEMFVQLMPLFLIFAIFYFLLIRPQQKRAKQHKEMVAAIQRGDKILSSGGMRGKVVRVINDNDIEVEISNGINVVMVKSTIAEVVKEQS